LKFYYLKFRELFSSVLDDEWCNAGDNKIEIIEDYLSRIIKYCGSPSILK